MMYRIFRADALSINLHTFPVAGEAFPAILKTQLQPYFALLPVAEFITHDEIHII